MDSKLMFKENHGLANKDTDILPQLSPKLSNHPSQKLSNLLLFTKLSHQSLLLRAGSNLNLAGKLLQHKDGNNQTHMPPTHGVKHL
jgi:hypothetical protein